MHGYITPVICSNIYYILRKYGSHNKVINKISDLLTILDVLQMDKKVIKSALISKFKDFEDALQNFAAVNSQNINSIITRNTKDYKFSELSVYTPEEYIRTIQT